MTAPSLGKTIPVTTSPPPPPQLSQATARREEQREREEGYSPRGTPPPPPRSPQPPTPAASQGTVSPQVSEFKNQNGLYGRTLRRNAMEATKPSLNLFAASLLTGSLFAVSQELRHRAVDTRPSAGLTPRPGPLRFFRVSFRFEKIYRVTV